jgi:hypothetical protein
VNLELSLLPPCYFEQMIKIHQLFSFSYTFQGFGSKLYIDWRN